MASNIHSQHPCISSYGSDDRNSFQGLLDLTLTERGLEPPGWQTVQILHCHFMQITFWQLPFHCCALVCQPISGLGIPQEMLTHLPYLLDWLSSWHIPELVTKPLISTCLQASHFATSSSICPPLASLIPFSLPSPKRKPYLLFKVAISLILHPSVYHLLPRSHDQSHLHSPGTRLQAEYLPLLSHCLFPSSLWNASSDTQFTDKDINSEKFLTDFGPRPGLYLVSTLLLATGMSHLTFFFFFGGYRFPMMKTLIF